MPRDVKIDSGLPCYFPVNVLFNVAGLKVLYMHNKVNYVDNNAAV